MLYYFLTMLMLMFAVVNILTGIFTIYFGSGRSKVAGVITIFLGLLILSFSLLFERVISLKNAPPLFFDGIIFNSIGAITGALVGVFIALGIFNLIVIKLFQDTISSNVKIIANEKKAKRYIWKNK